MNRNFSGLSYGLSQFANMLSAAVKKRRETRFLKKHGCETWDEYNRRYDPDILHRATRIRDYYHGYPYVYCVENSNHYAYQLLHDYGPGGYRYGYDEIVDWCKEHIKYKHRTDCHRVFRAPSTANEWEINEIGGLDYLFFAFQDERDYNWFMLRWL